MDLRRGLPLRQERRAGLRNDDRRGRHALPDADSHRSETGKSIFSVHGDGQIASLSGNYTGVSGDTYTGPAADSKSYNYYCGNYAGWTNGAQWHHITVVVTGATAQTQLGVSGNGSYSRFWIDNFKVSQKK